MQDKFEAQFQKDLPQMQATTFNQAIPPRSEIMTLLGCDRFQADAYSLYAMERRNGASQEDAYAYAKRIAVRASL